MKKFRVTAVATNRWTKEKQNVQGTIEAASEDWARVGAKDALDVDGYNVDHIEVREDR
ncbi:hypothetical protein KEF29_03280 [Streptomyces tuirus]|uniref:Uncharacterized protein n=1 Tax=Streptomyces tuirus TaxID=68278 RepID=A0A941FDY7_9ACTN|nr:hypothetical protein [Streptomyces tuirus]